MHNLGLFVIQKNKKTMIKEKGKEICQRVLDTNIDKRVEVLYTLTGKFLTGKLLWRLNSEKNYMF